MCFSIRNRRQAISPANEFKLKAGLVIRVAVSHTGNLKVNVYDNY